jgi:predicted alpha/beta-hydrolase family hydrolase
LAPPLKPESLRFVASKRHGEVSALLLRPVDARALLVLAHGAGAGMNHASMEAIAQQLATQRIATFRYQFPSMENGKRRPDPKPVAIATVRSALAAAQHAAGDLPLIAGGKSFGGRMTSLAAAQAPLPGVRGLAFFGFPLHPAGKPATERGEHLAQVGVPMLFLQGTRDKLADLELLRPVCEELGSAASLYTVEGADHSFHVLKRSGRSDEEVLEEIARETGAWFEKLRPAERS